MMKEMRRKDRRVTDSDTVRVCLEESKCMHVGFYDDGEVYVVPVNYGYVMEDENLTLYFHGAKAGRKAELAKTKPSVGFEMEAQLQPVIVDHPCDCTMQYLSVIGNGNLSIVEDLAEKKKGLLSVMEKETGRSDWEFPEKMVNATAVFKIEVTGFACKKNPSITNAN